MASTPIAPRTKRAPGGQPGNANRTTHGHYALARRLKGAGLAKLDGRSALERLKRDWKDDVRTALGGDLAPQKEALLELAANTWLMASSADDFILERGAINRRRGALRPIVEQRAKLVRTLRELLSELGLERVPVEAGETLNDVIARYEGGGPMGTPRLAAGGRSVPRKNRRNPGNEFPPGEPEHPAPSEVGASSSHASCSSSAAPVLSFSDDELSEGSSSAPASSSSGDPGAVLPAVSGGSARTASAVGAWTKRTGPTECDGSQRPDVPSVDVSGPVDGEPLPCTAFRPYAARGLNAVDEEGKEDAG